MPEGIAVDSSGNVYVADSSDDLVRRFSPGGQISTIAGNGSYGFSGDGGQATSAKLWNPNDVAVDMQGNVFVADSSNARIRRISASSGVIITIAGTTPGLSGDGGNASAAKLSDPHGLAFDGAGNLFIADTGNHRIRKIDMGTGIITTVAGTVQGFGGDGGLATSAKLRDPIDVFLDAAGNLYIADLSNNRIRKVAAGSGLISTIAGSSTSGYSGDGGFATNAALQGPAGVFVSAAGTVFFTDYVNHAVRAVGTDGRIRTLAGNGFGGFTGDGGPAYLAQLINPIGLAMSSSGDLLISDRGNRRIRKVSF